MSLPSALIGHTGFVGGTIARQQAFECLYNSQNIEQISGREFDVVVCAAAPGVKWKANKEPEADWATIARLIESLKTITARQFILISTIDVYPVVSGANEDYSIVTSDLAPYGRHRRQLEEFVLENFNALIVRLPGLFGQGLKKNPIYDLMHDSVEFIDRRGVFQFYNLANIWADINLAREHSVKIINLVTEPIGIAEIAAKIFGQTNLSELTGPVAAYDIHTKYASWWHNSPSYLYNKEQVLSDLENFKRAQV